MKGIELLRLGAEILKHMSEIDLRADDVKYLPLYEEYTSQRREGVKADALMMEISERTGISESTLRRAFRRLDRSVTV